MQRKKYDAAFKARVALEAVSGYKTINEIGAEYRIHPNVVSKWKRQLMEGVPGIFSQENSGKADRETEELISSLYRKIGQLEVEREWLKKKSAMLHPK